MAELKPCPFCGGTAIINYPAHNIAEVLCSRWSCRASISMGGERSLDKVIERWNKRAENEELKFTREFIHEHGLDFALASAWKGRVEDG